MSRGERVLVVDDEASIRLVLERALRGAGLVARTVASLGEAQAALERDGPWDVVLLDCWLPDGNGLDLLPRAQACRPAPAVVVMTARSSMEVTVEAMKLGAREFLVKPLDLDEVVALARRLGRGKDEVKAPPTSEPRVGRMLGESPAMVEVFKAIGRIAPTDETVLIVGESGTGKELVARAIHDHSARAHGPFVTVNCAAIPPDLMESELFGHERGSFTGAVARRKGKFELAGGGTVFLDEIGELPLPLQAKLLRVLQERQIERVGGGGPIDVDARVVAATHRDLVRLVREGRFREDLYYRLDVARLRLPPLRERGEDIALLARAFVARWGVELRGVPVELSEGALARLRARTWPGNVRELENVVKRALLEGRGAVLDEIDLEDRSDRAGPGEGARVSSEDPGDEVCSLEELVRRRLARTLDQVGAEPPPRLYATVIGIVERALIGLMLERTGGNQLEAARRLGMNRNTLRKRIADLKIPRPPRRSG